MAVGLQEMFHGRRPLAAMKHFLRDHRERITESGEQRPPEGGIRGIRIKNGCTLERIEGLAGIPSIGLEDL